MSIATRLVLFVFCGISFNSYAQDDGERFKRFQAGLQTGGYFPNKATAIVYNGYGFDINNNNEPLDFDNSVLKNALYNRYNASQTNPPIVTGQPDIVAEALGVDPGQWMISESDMPQKMKYQPGLMFGVAMRYRLNKAGSIILNANFMKLNVTGAFTIELLATPVTPSDPGTNPNVQSFGIFGEEQRFLAQLGYQRLLSENDNFCLFIEAGWNLSSVKFQKSYVLVHNLLIDLTPYYDYSGFGAQRPKTLGGIGFGAFGGIGINLSGEKLAAQVFYQPSLETIRLGVDPRMRLQHVLGLRLFGIL